MCKTFITNVKIKQVAVVIMFLLLIGGQGETARAQLSVNMPYTMYGVGDVQFNQYLQNMGMGGLSQGYRSHLSVNDVNPASYAAFDSNSFVFETTLLSQFYRQKTTAITQESDYYTLGNLSLGFPVTSWWSVGAGLKPYSRLGYKVSDRETGTEAGAVDYIYEGNGGISQLFLGSAIEPFDGFSVGANFSYLFGNLDDQATVESDSVGVYQTNMIQSDRVSGLLVGFGLQYHHEVTEHRHITVGATFGNQTDVGVTSKETLRRREPNALRYDTIAHNILQEGNITLPAYYGIGVFSGINENWEAGIDFQWQNWEDFSYLGDDEDFNNHYEIASGVRFSPDAETYSTIFRRFQYKAGLRYGQSYLRPDDKTLNEFGISFGVGIPIRGTQSGLSIDVELSRRAAIDNSNMHEDFFRVNLGINIFERWFVRRRFN